MADPLPEFIFDLVNGPILTLVSGSVSASMYLTAGGRVGMGDPSLSSPSVDTAMMSYLARTSSYVSATDVDVFKTEHDGTGVGGIIYNSHFISATTALVSDFATTVSGTSAAGSLIAGELGPPGIAQLTTGTTATGRASFNTFATAIRFGGGNYTFECIVRLPSMSDSTNRFTIYAGFGDNTSSGDMVDGAYFQYTDASSSFWQIKTSTNSVRTTTTTTSTPIAATWYKLKVVVSDVTLASFYVNDVLVGTINNNIPQGSGRETGIILKIEKSVGTTARLLQTDYMKVAFA